MTGSGAGIGRAAAIRFAEEGARVVVSDVNTDGGNETVALIKQSGGDAVFVRADAAKAAEVEALVASVVDSGLASISRVRVLGPLDTHDRRGVVTFSVEGVSAEDVCRFLDRRGVALRGGHHCAQPLVRAFGVEGAARASLAPYSLDADITALLDGLDVLCRALRSQRGNAMSAGRWPVQ